MAVVEAVMPAIAPFPGVLAMEGKQFDNVSRFSFCKVWNYHLLFGFCCSLYVDGFLLWMLILE